MEKIFINATRKEVLNFVTRQWYLFASGKSNYSLITLTKDGKIRMGLPKVRVEKTDKYILSFLSLDSEIKDLKTVLEKTEEHLLKFASFKEETKEETKNENVITVDNMYQLAEYFLEGILHNGLIFFTTEEGKGEKFIADPNKNNIGDILRVAGF